LPASVLIVNVIVASGKIGFTNKPHKINMVDAEGGLVPD
jgi:hypothetical protein